MSIFKKGILFLLCLSSLLLPLSPRASALDTEAPPAVSAQSAILIEATSGRVIYEKDADRTLPMASTTKIMTALVALENASPEAVITIDPAAVGTEGSSVYLSAGERLTLEQLLYALLLESANDAAVAIAVGVAGSTEAFVERMNEKAAALGLLHTRFENPHGLDHKDHYTTARELSEITRAALENELIKTIVSTRKATIPHAEAEGGRLLVNHNKLLRMYEGCIGVKTGYTQRSGRCLVSAALREGLTLIAVTINAPDDWDDHTRMLDYGFSRFHTVTLCESNALLYPLCVVGGTDAYVMLANTSEVRAVLPRGSGEIKTRIECRRFEYANVSEGSVLGRAVFLCDTNGDGTPEEVGNAPLKALYTVPKKASKNKFRAWIKSLFD